MAKGENVTNAEAIEALNEFEQVLSFNTFGDRFLDQAEPELETLATPEGEAVEEEPEMETFAKKDEPTSDEDSEELELEEPLEDKEEAQAEPSELETLREQNKIMAKQLEEISAKIFGKAQDNQPVKDQPEAKPIQFIDEEGMQSLFESPDNLNRLLNETMQKTISTIVRDLPQVINSEVMKTVEIQSTINRFYEQNPDLTEHSQYLGYISTEIAQKEPQLTLNENLKRTAEEFRKRTGIRASTERENPKAPLTKPSTKKLVTQAPAGSARPASGKSAKDSLQEEIQQILAYAGPKFD